MRRTVRKSGENPAQYPLLYWRSGIPVCAVPGQKKIFFWKGIRQRSHWKNIFLGRRNIRDDT